MYTFNSEKCQDYIVNLLQVRDRMGNRKQHLRKWLFPQMVIRNYKLREEKGK
jgi:hypothetical protein